MVSQLQFRSSPGSAETKPKPDRATLLKFPTGEEIIPAEPLTDSFAEPAIKERNLPSATPESVLLGTLPHFALRLRRPLPLIIEREGDQIGAWAPDLQEFGYGAHLSLAIEDLQQTIVELYLTLEADEKQGHLGPGTIEVWRRLQDWIEHRP